MYNVTYIYAYDCIRTCDATALKCLQLPQEQLVQCHFVGGKVASSPSQVSQK